MCELEPERSNMETNYFQFMQNERCEFFPCHSTQDSDTFNCLFCYCPLYSMKDKCGGNFQYLPNGIKDCSACMIPHSKNGYEYIMNHMEDIIQLGKL